MCNFWIKFIVSSGLLEVRLVMLKVLVSVGNVLLYRDVYEEEFDKEVMIFLKVLEINMLIWKLFVLSLVRVKSRLIEGMLLDRVICVLRLMVVFKDLVRVIISLFVFFILVGFLLFM